MMARLRAVALKEMEQKLRASLMKREIFFFCSVHQIVSANQKALFLHCVYLWLADMQHNGVNSRP